jgi:flagellin
MSVINTNVKSLVAQNALTVNNRSLSKSMEQLSTGKRINSAADDAAGLAISNKMTSQIRGLNQAVRNANDGISMMQTAEGATQEISNMLQRMRELAVQGANDTYGAADRAAIGKEYDQLIGEIDRIAGNTEWNGIKLLDGSTFSSATAAVLQVGTGSGSAYQIEVNFLAMTTSAMSTAAIAASDITSASTAGELQAVITALDTNIAAVDAFRADLGAKVNRLTYAADNMANISMNTSASRSRIQDADYASATTELARSQIISQAATAMLAQANQAPQSVLSLLR